MRRNFTTLSVSIFTLCLLLINSNGSLVVLMALQQRAHHSVWKDIQSGNSDLAVANLLIAENDIAHQTNGFEWKEENKEFIYNGKMYDIVSSEMTDAGVNIRAVNDEQETAISGMVSNQIEQIIAGTENKNSSPVLLLQHLEKNYLPENFNRYIFSIECPRIISDVRFIPLSIVRPQLCPPPESRV